MHSEADELETFRVLIEEGDSDPMALTESRSSFGACCAAHLHRGHIDGFRLMCKYGRPGEFPSGFDCDRSIFARAGVLGSQIET